MDNLTKKQRKLCMFRIRSKDTKPEKIVRKILTRLGWRYRLHNTALRYAIEKMPENLRKKAMKIT
ncbi:MAG: hypothetical protein KKH94_04970 [Candidatus Omnitrophica bacterium]|nr:hypothetical protein [Candidatus Omnitrophota bacterium]